MDEERGGTVFVVGPAHSGQRLDRFLQQRIPRLSRTAIQRAIAGRVQLHRQPHPKPSTRLRTGDEVLVGFARLFEDPQRLRRIHLPVLHEDGALLAVDKPAGMVVHPTHSVYRGSVIIHLRERHPGGRLALVHRLDRETSGVLLLAKSTDAARALHRSFVDGLVKKRYLAVVRPRMAEREGVGGVLDFPLGPDVEAAERFKRRVDPQGAPARTRFRVLRNLPGCSLLEVLPLSGRQHQIRVHLQRAGHPVVGDRLYGGGRPPAGSLPPARHLLHAEALEFPRPVTGEPLVIRSPVPDDLQRYLDAAEASSS